MQWLISMSFLYLPHCFLSLPSQRKKEGVILLISHGKDALYKKLSLRQLLHGFARRPIGRGEIHAPPKRKHTPKVCGIFHEEYNCPPQETCATCSLNILWLSEEDRNPL